MKRCDAMVDVGRRKFLTGAGVAAAGAAAGGLNFRSQGGSALPRGSTIHPTAWRMFATSKSTSH